ncbi:MULTISPECIES: ABC transporter permease [Bifidobacterium]|uniref:ABC transporter permease n=1 Tax=Bifidobacterium fermentum TaxID=3059035 RepID=A0AB39UCD6_9BIFI|nr:ABC transporter permease [Bifidobacterium psychraerophilum]PKA94288.1 peptide/nickel transport system permease protein [Bifidobacterium psychraerophilum DSM 22366]
MNIQRVSNIGQFDKSFGPHRLSANIHSRGLKDNFRAVFPFLRFLGARIVQAAFVVWFVVTFTFAAVHLAPGDVIDSLLTDTERSNIELRLQAIKEWGLDRPVFVQYLGYFGRLLRGDLGVSYVQKKSVNAIFAEQFPYTLSLTATAIVIAILVALVGSLAISQRSNRFVKTLYEGAELTLLSTPPFWFGILLLAFFSFKLGWFPVAGDEQSWRSLVLPAVAIGIPEGGYLSQILRQGIAKNTSQPFVVTARSWGLSWPQITRRNLLKHSSIPAITVGAMMVGELLGGAVITEKVFGRPGLGQIAVDAITSKDIPVILAVAFVTSIVFVVASTVIDVLYYLIDPRIRLVKEEAR